LPGEKLQTLAGRQFEFDDHYIRGGSGQAVHACGQGSDRNVIEEADLPAFDDQVAARHGAAEEGIAGMAVGLAEDIERCLAMRYLAAQHFAPTRAANAIATAVGKA
jgi:hypothetical protein